MNFRPVTIDDAQLLYSWRTDAVTVDMSISAIPISYESHLAWLRAALTASTRLMLIFEDASGIPVGTLRSDRQQDGAMLSWSICPKHRGQGIGKKMLRTFVAENDGPFWATVKAKNLASIKMCESVGFKQTEIKDDYIIFALLDKNLLTSR